ncbi:single-strand selective monofunctional uracil DNA glycosylase-like [Daphnia carinata]|uniref:single-strand selective monofunctional uracil DNA glycosylase-like n=1 Tax=Daphnia carinata TaxID=120202 RepID=UPI00257C98EF|nr:single-strand selective monofunctional uracil DNA glycosylase-like [Daphnia carinata]
MDLFNVTPSTASSSTLTVPTYVDASTGMTPNEVKHGVDETQGQLNTTASIAVQILNIESRLSNELNRLLFSPPVAYVYNPLNYAWETHGLFVTKYGNSKKQILFVGMNPGPWGMVQTGIPFGAARLVQDWLGIVGTVGHPPVEHPQRKVQGFQCPRTEVSGQRFWGFFRDICFTPENMFKNCFVYSYCPLSFMHTSGRNITPPELKSSDRQAIMELCDTSLGEIITVLKVDIVIGIGKFAEYRVRETVKKHSLNVTIGCILHPSPINPSANKGWKEAVLKSMQEMNILHIVRGDQQHQCT